MNAAIANLGFLGAMIVAAVIPNGVWRWIAVFATSRLDDGSPFFAWIRHVATCLVAGVVAQLLISPSGVLASAPIALRFGALLFAAIVWKISGARVLVGWMAGVAALMIGAALV
ncbi:AzlD domain-containing protein [Terrarubrum flagellatum]|uniref:AzlD domain-containing protein n=1 Tax=Terrirubrum flagellatum TaxID=2895980 RepID=UPI0031452318